MCYLQVLLAGELPGVGRARLIDDMDAWGYSFRLGSTRAWFEADADECTAVAAQPRHHRCRGAADRRCPQLTSCRAQKLLATPAKMPRRGPYCGAPTPTPVPSRISYFSSNTLMTSKRTVRPAMPCRSNS